MELKHQKLYRVKTGFAPRKDSRSGVIPAGTILRYDSLQSLGAYKMFWSSEAADGWNITRLLTIMELNNLTEVK